MTETRTLAHELDRTVLVTDVGIVPAGVPVAVPVELADSLLEQGWQEVEGDAVSAEELRELTPRRNVEGEEPIVIAVGDTSYDFGDDITPAEAEFLEGMTNDDAGDGDDTEEQ